MKISFDTFQRLLLRFASRGPRYFGTMTIKYFNGEIVHFTAEDSFDVKLMKHETLTLNEDNIMFKKVGAPNIKDEKSSKIIKQEDIEEEIKEEKQIEDKNKKEGE